MYKTEGVYGFFRGNAVNVLRIAPLGAIELLFYEHYKVKYFYGEKNYAQCMNSPKNIK